MTRNSMLMQRISLLLVGMSISAPAMSAGPIYFHKAGIDRASFATEFGECDELAGGVRAPPPIQTYSPNMYALAVNSLFNGFFQSREKRSMVDNVLRTCMADKGYRRIRASKEVLKVLNALKDKERVDRLFELAADQVPVGEVLPR